MDKIARATQEIGQRLRSARAGGGLTLAAVARQAGMSEGFLSKLERGQEFGAKHTVVGYECDGCEFEMKDGVPVATCRDGTPEGFTILATCPTRWHPDDALWYDRFPRDAAGA